MDALGAVEAIEEDRIIRRYVNLVQSSLRTNYFQRAADGASKSYLSIKFDSRAVELSPQTSYVRRQQHQLAERYRLQSRSTGLEPNRRVRIFKTVDLP